MPRELRCPTCIARFPAPTGGESRAQCPGCGEEIDLEPVAARPAPKKKKRVGVVDLDDEYDDEPEPEPRPRRARDRRRSAEPGGRVLVAVGGAVAALLVLGGVGWGVWRLVRADPEFKEFAPAGGNFTVLMPGDPDRKGMNFGALALTAWEGKRGGMTYVVGYSDGQLAAAADDAAVSFAESVGTDGGMAELDSGWGPAGQWFEFQIGSDDKARQCSGRVCMVGNRFYTLLAHGKGAKRSNAEVRRFLDSFKLADGPAPWEEKPADPAQVPARPPPKEPPEPEPDRPAPEAPKSDTPRLPLKLPRANTPAKPQPKGQSPQPARGEMLGGSGDPPFRDAAPAGGLLVGFDVGLEKFIGYPVVGMMQPIYRVGDKLLLGKPHGTKRDMGVKRLLAKPGYAVGAVTARTGLAIDGMSVTFMRVTPDGELDPRDAYESEWVGNTTGGSGPTRLTGNVTPAVGVIGRHNPERVSAIGLLFPGK